MIEITPAAYEEMATCFKNPTQKESVRIFLNEKGCHGPSLKMVLHAGDPARDEITEYEHFFMVIARDLLAKAGNIKLDYTPGLNFKITTDNPDIGSRCMGCYTSSGWCLNSDFNKKPPSVSPFAKKK